jgi:hypothetical protein
VLFVPVSANEELAEVLSLQGHNVGSSGFRVCSAEGQMLASSYTSWSQNFLKPPHITTVLFSLMLYNFAAAI